MPKKYKAVKNFLNAKQENVTNGDPMNPGDYSKVVFDGYLSRGFVVEVKEDPKKPAKNKQVKPSKNK